MKPAVRVCLSVLVCWGLIVNTAHTEDSSHKLGVDKRHALAQNIQFSPSNEVFHWKMVTPWSRDLLFYDIAAHFCDSVRLASAGRLDIRPFTADELVPAMQTFDAVSQGIVEVGHDFPGYWKEKNEAFVAFASVPFGLDAEGYNIWLYEKGGLEMMQELYGRFNLYALPGGQVGQEMGLFSNKRATEMEDFAGMRVRTVGWYMEILHTLGALVSPLPGGQVYLALERNMIDAAEFSSPAMNYAMRFDAVTKYSLQPGVHQPGLQCNLFFNQEAWDTLPEDLKWIVDIAARETQLWSYTWVNNLNAEAIRRFQEHIEIVIMDQDTLISFRKITKQYLDGLKQKYPDVKKVLDSQEAFLKEYAVWRNARSGVAPWPYETYISGRTTE
ncbi:MAG: TRAP transporter substrate-binding protein DctP [Candidatus Vecturithrix sp.]|nr:TRAP transporter substrate-binding protein DctP [Candidatus Vecturithrix sp.]